MISLPHHPPVHDAPDADESGKVVEQEHAQVAHHLVGIGGGVQFIGDHAGHGGDQGAQASYVHSQQQFPGVAGEAGQQHGRGHVADKLAGHDAGHVYDAPGVVQVVMQLPDGVPVGQVADEDEKADEGQQQGVVRQFQQAAVGQGHHDHYDNGAYQGAYQVGHGQKAQQQQRGKEQDLRPQAGFRFPLFQLQLAVGQSVNQQRQPQRAQYGQRPQHGKKVARAQSVVVVDEQVLGIPHGGAGAAQVGSQGLKDDDTPHIQPDLFARNQGQGHKDQKGHIVCHQHGQEKCQPDQHRRHMTGATAAGE